MKKLTLTEDDRAAIVNSLYHKAEGDEKTAAELDKGWPEASRAQIETSKRLAFTLREQAKKERALAEKIEDAEQIELC